MDGFSEQNYTQKFDDELLAVDKMIMDAAAATDAGDFRGALNTFRCALKALKTARQYISASPELAHLEASIAEMDELLSNISNTSNINGSL